MSSPYLYMSLAFLILSVSYAIRRADRCSACCFEFKARITPRTTTDIEQQITPAPTPIAILA